MRTIKLWLTTIATLWCSLAANAHDFEVGGIYYDITSSADLTVEVTYRGSSSGSYDNEYSGAVTIPSTVTYNSKTYSVTSIGNYAFSGCSRLTTITIPEGVTSIGDHAFHDCSSLTAITIPESVTSIGNYAFAYCSSLTSITIPEGVTSIGSYAFYNCSSLTSITIPEGVTSIGSYAFDICSSLYKVINCSNLSLSKGSSSNGYVAYYAKVVYQGDELTIVGDFQFYTSDGIHSLVNYIGNDTEIVLPDSYNGENYKIGDCAFSGCSRLTSITIPESVTSIGDYAFYKCSSLTSITIPEGVTRIGSYAFYNCSSLTSITIPEGVTSIGSYAFYYCSSLYKVINCSNLSLSKGSSSNGYVAYYAKVVYQGDELTIVGDFQFYTSDGIHSLVNYIGNDTEIVLPDSYNGENYKIGDCAFSGCSSLTSITIPEGVTSIGDYAFYGCSSLTSITIPEGVTSIGEYAFYRCSSLTAITLPESVTSIGNYAFAYCSSLTSITIPEGVTSIGDYAFEGCTALKKVIIEDGSTTLSLGYNYYYNNSSTGQGLFYDCPLEEVYLGRNLSYESGKSYGYSPFYNKDALTNVTIGNEVTQISENAFYSCDNIHSLTISSGVLSIGSNAFSTPEKVIWLTNTPPTGYTNAKGSINYVANDLYTSLSNVKVYPYLSSMFEVEGVKYVPVSPAERTCDAIDCAYNSTAAAIYVSETASFKGIAMTVKEVMPYTFYGNKHIKEVNISHKGNIGNYAFFDCDSVQSVELSNEGNVGSQAFYDCDGMLTATISNQGNIESQAFYDCDGIKSLDISNVGYVGDEAFCGCGALETAIVANTGAVNSSAFSGCSLLKSVTLGDKVTSLGNDAFRGCISLQEIVIPNSVKSVGTYCFSGCSVMKSAVIGNGLTDIKEYTFADCGLEEILIGDNITSIGDYAFKGCTGMKHAVLGNGLTIVNGTMFSGCIGLEKVEMGNKIRTLAANAFSGCSALKDVALGSSVATINNYAFQGCSSLPEITLPQAVTKVGDYVFAGCSKLADVMIADRTTPLALGSNGSSPLFADCPLDSVYIGGKITYSTTSSKGYSPFYRNTSLRTIVITDREEQIYNNEYYGCTNLKNVTIGNGVKSIGNYAFSGCSSLEGFSFGSNMESIGAEAFSDCTNLTSITSHAAVPPTCGTQALDDINKWNCILRVPSGYTAAYQAAEQWKEFFFIEDVVEVEKYVLTYVVDGEVYHTEALPHKTPITAIAEPTKEGYTFSGWDEVPETMPAEDVTINGKFTVNKYLVTFKVDGEIVYSESLEYGASIVVPEAPEKEGHTFNGWGEVDTTVPAYDVTYEANYSVNSYQLTYVVDGETVQTESVAYGTAITLIDEPVKEGYTFSGWGEVPETMPAHDVTLNGTFTVNKYLVTFTVDGAVIASDSLEYGTAISVPTMPEREGYTFSGWSEVAETVPAHDVTYDASYTANIYKVYYFVGATLVHTAEVAYGEAIPEYIYEPTAEGDVFLGWVGESYETMPAHDVTYTANITNDVLQLTIDNGQLTIYDLGGRKIEVDDLRELRKGIYIINGQKVIIKD